jgi:hypothetical protein
MVALKLGEEGFTKSHAESIYYLIYGKIDRFLIHTLPNSIQNSKKLNLPESTSFLLSYYTEKGS